MRFLVSAVLIFSLLFQNLGKTIIVASFLSNQRFIAQNLCENRGKPEMHCNGKCHLRKQIQKEDQDTPKIPQALKNYEELAAGQCEAAFCSFEFSSGISFSFPEFSSSIQAAFGPSVFHPPAVIC